VNVTPGPWTVEGTQIYAPWGAKRRVIAKTGQTYAWGDGYVMAEADARLMAAAPDLLEALEEAHGILQYNLGDVDPHVRSACDLMWIAIAKAKGPS
jgi:hypothetical protein